MPPPIRVAMLVLNPCDSDARVLREAATLRDAGHEVRIFAFSNREFPPGVVEISGMPVERLPVAALYTSLLRRLSRRGASVSAARTASPPVPAPASTPAPAPSSSGELRRFLVGRAYAVHRPYTVASYWRVAARRVSQWRPDVVHAHDLNTLPVASFVARRCGSPLVYDSHELWRRRNRHGEYRPLARVFEAMSERVFIRRADAILTVSPGLADWLRRRYRPRVQIRVLRNVPPCRSAAPAASLAELAGCPGRRILLYTGRAMPGRGLEMAVASLPSLPPDVDLVLLGYGDRSYAARLTALAQRHGVDARVHFVAAVPPDSVPAVASGATAALVAVEPVCESYRYALPNKLFEAIQAGLPVIASDLPDISRVVRSYGIGELFVPGDAASYVAAAQTVLADPSRFRDNSAAAGRELCWENERDVLLDVYRSIDGQVSRRYAESQNIHS